MCIVYEVRIEGEVKGNLYEFSEMGKVAYHEVETNEVKLYKNKLFFEKQFYDSKTAYFLEATHQIAT